MKLFPVKKPEGFRGRLRNDILPWRMVEAHQAQARANHGQTVERLAERGGLTPDEAVAVLTDRAYAPMTLSIAEEVLDGLLRTYHGMS